MGQLRYYQQEAVDSVYRFFESNAGRNPCVVLPTGAGKTHVIAKLCEDVQGWGGRVLVVAHVKELLEQAASKLEAIGGLDVGVYSAGLKRRDKDNRIIVGGIQSMCNRGLELTGSDPFSLVVVDEAHRIPIAGNGQYCKLLSDLVATNQNLKIVGLTATPYRTGAGYVCSDDHFLNEICYEANVADLIERGYLCELASAQGTAGTVDMGGVKRSGGDYNQSEMESLFSDEEKVTLASGEIVKLTEGRRKVLVFCCGIDHAEAVAEQLRSRDPGERVGIVTSVHGGRDETIRDFKAGEIKYLVNVNCLCEGFDATAIDCVVLLRATCSPGLYYQMVGRGLRIDESKKDCLVLDYGGNIERHGTIDDLNIKDGGKANAAGDAPVKFCPECKKANHAAVKFCQFCLYEFPDSEPEVRHETKASKSSPLSGKTQIHEIDRVSYRVHKPRRQPGQKPKTPSMRVTYEKGMATVAEEWICLEHGGYAREKAVQWWNKRCSIGPPPTIEDAVEIANNGELAEPKRIEVKQQPGEFARVTKYEMEELPREAIPLDDVPF